MALPRNRPDLASLSSLGDPVRGRLYEFICGRSEPVGRDEAAAAVGIGRALAVYHLDKLVGAGLLTASYRRPSGRRGPGAGRPAKVYARSRREFTVSVPPRDYELAARLLAQAVEADRSGRCRDALLAAARQLGAGLARGRRTGAGAPPASGPAAAARAVEEVLREHGFDPRDDDEGVVRLRNCPFHPLARRHPGIVCGMNLALIEGLVDGIGASGLRPVLDPKPGHCCVAIGARTR